MTIPEVNQLDEALKRPLAEQEIKYLVRLIEFKDADNRAYEKALIMSLSGWEWTWRQIDGQKQRRYVRVTGQIQETEKYALRFNDSLDAMRDAESRIVQGRLDDLYHKHLQEDAALFDANNGDCLTNEAYRDACTYAIASHRMKALIKTCVEACMLPPIQL
jgi:hypothetical protein